MSVIDCFWLDDISNANAVAVYDTDSNRPVLIVTPEGQIKQIRPNKHRVIVPTFVMPESLAEQYAAKMLVWAAIANRKKQFPGRRDARKTLGRRDLIFNKILTSKDSEFIPPDLSIAVSEPTFLGVHVINQDQRGLVIWNFGAVIGYQPGSKNGSDRQTNGTVHSLPGI